MAKTYYIFRHGDTYATKNRTDYGDQILTAPIISEAKVYLKRLGLHLSLITNTHCVSSEILRCRQTVEIISEVTRQPFIFDRRLNEYNMETYDEFIDRMQDFARDMALRSENNIVICTHGAGIGALKQLLINGDIVEENLLAYPDPGVLTIITKGEVKTIDFRE